MQPTPEQANWIIRSFEGGGNPMYVIAAIGFLTIILIIYRFYADSHLSIDKVDFNEKIAGMLMRGEIEQAIRFCDSRSAPLTQTIKAGLVQVYNGRTDEEVQVAMDAVILRETPNIEGWTGFLAVFGNVSTLVGLFGTIIGLIGSFRGIGAADPAKKAELLSKGISEALNCTAFGLLVAIIAILAFGFFQTKISRRINDLVESSMNLMNLVVSNRDKMKT